MASPSVETMWQEIRRLKTRICELEAQVGCMPTCDEQQGLIDVWIDYDDVPVIDSDLEKILHGQ
jgi:hypothetical protein